MSMQLKVVLATGEVTVPVEPNSTPGHLKENLKYSIRLPPKFIKLTCEGRELDDNKQLSAPENNLVNGSVVVAGVKEGKEVEAAEAQAAAEIAERKAAQPTVIKKEEPVKAKKPKKDAVRPVLAEGDVVKKETLEPGYKPWKPDPAFLEGKSSRRHLAMLKLKTLDDNKCYPQQDEGSMALALGDPHTSPVWTEIVSQMEIGEKSVFAVSKKAVDFDPEGLNPTDHSQRWSVELQNIVEVLDVNEDFSVLLHVEAEGGKERVAELDRVSVHWRVRRWMAEGTFCIGSSRERIAILPGYGLVPIEDMNAPPVSISCGEGQQEAVELVTKHCGPGGKGNVYLKTEAMKANRPGGCVILDVEIVAIEPTPGPDAAGWQGWSTIVNERETGDNWLEEADSRRKQLETFGMMRKSTGDSKDAEEHVANQVHKFAKNAERRYRRALRWAEGDADQDKKMKLEQMTLQMRLAKAQALTHMRFGDNLGEASEAEKHALTEARELLRKTLAMAEEMKSDHLIGECLKLTLQACIQAEDVKEAKLTLEKLQTLRPHDEELKSDSARLNRMEQAMALRQGGASVETLQLRLRKANDEKDLATVGEVLAELTDLMKTNKVTYETIKNLKVGKDVGNSIKLGDPDMAKAGHKCVSEIQALAQRNSIGL